MKSGSRRLSWSTFTSVLLKHVACTFPVHINQASQSSWLVEVSGYCIYRKMSVETMFTVDDVASGECYLVNNSQK
jgi:hypothetical protein